MEKYVEYISNDKLRTGLAAFGLSAHNMDIERGRNFNAHRENRVCRLCPMLMVESEFLFLQVCPQYNDRRGDLLLRTAWPAVAKFVSTISSKFPISSSYIVKYHYVCKHFEIPED